MNALDRKGCGTDAGYRWHLRNEGKPVTCRACLQANARRMAARDRTEVNRLARERYAALRARGYSSAEATRLRWRKETEKEDNR